MKKFFKVKDVLCILFVSQFIGINIAKAESINLIASLSIAPFVIEEGSKGMQLDIIRSALSLHNIEVNFIHVPLSRNVISFKSLNSDGVITLPTDYSYPNMVMSSPYITYQNVAISLTERNLDITKVSDLSDKSVVAFQNAKKFMEDGYSKAINYSLDYKEVAKQELQIKMLFMGRTEVIVLDHDIFKHFINTSTDPIFGKNFTVHYIFNPRDYAIGFRDEAIRDKFNLGLKIIKDQGEYQNIVEKYLN